MTSADVDAARAMGRKTVQSGAVQLAGAFAELLALFASGIIMAHLLGPKEFGLYAMVISLTSVVDTFGDLGLNYAAVQHRALSQNQLSALFWISARFNFLVLGAVALAGPLLSLFYDERALVFMTGVAGLAAFSRGLASQHESSMMREMRFGGLKAIELTATFLGAATGIGLAMAGAGAWSLVGQLVMAAASRSIGLWLIAAWRPGPYAVARADIPNVQPMLRYGTHFSAYRLVMYAGRQIDRVLLGRVAGTVPLGFYASAGRWALYPIDMVSNPLTGVAIAGLTQYKADPTAYRTAYRAGLLPFFSLIVPSVTFAILMADTLVVKVLGTQWAPSAPIFRILCVASLTLALDRACKWIYLSTGDTERQFRWALIFTPIVAACVVVGVQFGATGVAIGYACGTGALAIPGLVYCLRPTPVRVRDVLGALARPVAAAALSAGLTLLLTGAPETDLNGLMLRAIVFSGAYAAWWVVLPGGRAAVTEMLRIVRHLTPAGSAAR